MLPIQSQSITISSLLLHDRSLSVCILKPNCCSIFDLSLFIRYLIDILFVVNKFIDVFIFDFIPRLHLSTFNALTLASRSTISSKEKILIPGIRGNIILFYFYLSTYLYCNDMILFVCIIHILLELFYSEFILISFLSSNKYTFKCKYGGKYMFKKHSVYRNNIFISFLEQHNSLSK